MTAAPLALTGSLAGSLDFSSVPALLGQHAGSAVSALDLAGVTRVDSAGLALLLELKRESKAVDGLRFLNAPAQLRQLAEFFDLTELLAIT